MVKSIIKKQFHCDKDKLWDVITDNYITLGEVIYQKLI